MSTSTPAAGATGVTYKVGFKTSSTGQLVRPGKITLTAPAGTFTNASFSARDVTDGNRSLSVSQSVAAGGGQVVLTVFSGTPTAPGDVIEVTFTDATNPGGPSPFDIKTSSDAIPVTTPPYTLAGGDTTPPDTTITSGPSGPTSDSTPTFTFTSDEPGSTFECRVDSAAFTPCSSPHTTATLVTGPHTFEVRAIDAASNVDQTPASRSFTVSPPPDTTPPQTTVTGGPSGPTSDSTPTFTFTSDEPGSTFQCRVDAAPFAPCSSPHTTAALAAGPHTFEVRAIDPASNVDQTPASRPFTVSAPPPPPPVDNTPPQTIITAGPSGPTSNRTPTFVFSSNEAGSTFQCRVDGGPFFPCSSPFTTPRLGDGPHTFEVRAIDRAGNVDASPAYGFGLEAARRTFTVQSAPSKPVLAKTVNVEPVKGKVFVSVPAGGARASATTVPGLKSRRFVPLSEARQVPVGSLLDTRRGMVRLTSARDSQGTPQSSEFASGVVQVLQSRKRSARGLTELRLKGSSFRACATGGAGKRSSAQAKTSRGRSRRTIRRLRGRGSGRFSTRGRYSAATVRGTDWTVSDRCDGTLTKVKRGKVAVRDFRRRKTVTVRAGKSYLARARR